MTLNEIKSAMKKWSDERNQAGLTKMTIWLNQGNMFSFQNDPNNQPLPNDSDAYIHIYPGIISQQGMDILVFFVISAYKDVSTNANIANDVQVCNIATGQPSPISTGGLPTQEALARIQSWQNGHNAWISQNISAPNSIFQAFVMPQADGTLGNQHNSFLALNPDNNAHGGYVADLIVEDINAATISYFDTVTMIPPMGSGHLAPSRFYLLGLL